MRVEITRRAERMTAHLIGELDHHGAAAVREQIDNAALQQRCRQMTLDFSGLTFMDSSGIGLIMGRYRLMRSIGGSLSVVGADERLERVIRLSGLEKLPIWEEKEGSKINETDQ